LNLGLHLRLGAFILACVTCFTTSAFAVDGIVLIDQARALAGNVTPGDEPGFPVAITVPGSYRLSGNLTVPAGGVGILVGADNVTIDLNGFQIAGTNREGTGVGDSGLRHGTTVRNGTITNFFAGISLVRTDGAEITQVRAIANAQFGILVDQNSIVTGNVAGRGAFGIVARDGSLVSGNLVFGNTVIGIDVIGGSVIGNIARGNGTQFKIFCPSNLVANTALLGGDSLETAGSGCTFANNNLP
jgi:hypothetical protein